MRDLHEVVIDHIGKVVGRVPISLYNDEIFRHSIPDIRPIHEIFDGRSLVSSFKSYAVCLTAGSSLVRLAWGNVRACARILCMDT